MRTDSFFYPGLFTRTEQNRIMSQPHDSLAGQAWDFIADARSGFLNRYPELYVCCAPIDYQPPTFYFCRADGIPLFVLHRSNSSKRRNGVRQEAWSISSTTRAEYMVVGGTLAQYTELPVLLRSISPERRTKQGNLIPEGKYASTLQYQMKSLARTKYIQLCMALVENYANTLKTSFDTTDWALTREQQITLMAAHLNKIKREEVPDTVTAAVANAFAQLQRVTDSKQTINKECNEMFHRDKWIITYMGGPLKYYIVGKANTEWMYKAAVLKATGGYFNGISYENLSPPVNLKAYRSLVDLPDDIRDDVNGAVAMYMMGRGNCSTIDPDKLIPTGPSYLQELGAASYSMANSTSNGILVLDA